MKIIDRYLDGVRRITSAIEARCVGVDHFLVQLRGARPPTGMDVVWEAYDYPMTYYAAPLRARLYRLWARGRWAWKPIRFLRATGFLRFEPWSTKAHWSYPFRRKDVNGYVTPWESAILWRIYKWRERRELKRIYGVR